MKKTLKPVMQRKKANMKMTLMSLTRKIKSQLAAAALQIEIPDHIVIAQMMRRRRLGR